MSEKAKTQENSTFKEYIYPVVILTGAPSGCGQLHAGNAFRIVLLQ